MVWFVLAGGLLLAELFSLTFVLGLFAVAATLAGAGAAFGLPAVGQFAAFSATSGVLWVLVKPLERANRRLPALPTGTAAIAGRTGLVTEDVTTHTGRVQLGGESWAARSLAPGATLSAGTTVGVASVDGATLVVFPEEI